MTQSSGTSDAAWKKNSASASHMFVYFYKYFSNISSIFQETDCVGFIVWHNSFHRPSIVGFSTIWLVLAKLSRQVVKMWLAIPKLCIHVPLALELHRGRLFTPHSDGRQTSSFCICWRGVLRRRAARRGGAELRCDARCARRMRDGVGGEAQTGLACAAADGSTSRS
eukprot:6206860-Pleurochrysis_carterae.AAC.3